MIPIEGAFDVVGAAAPLAFFGPLERRRLAHGYLFTGPPGVGKKTFARRLAQSLLCETPKDTLLGYCGACPACRLFVARTHPDYVEHEGTIKIGKEAGAPREDELSARDLVRELSLHGYRSALRIVVLGDVAFATHEAANALLRFFEEPPAGVIVILTTDAPGALLATIRSRFVEIAFGPLSVADVARILTESGVAPERAQAAAAVALGSITRAREVLDDDDAGVRDAAFAWFVRAMRGEEADASFLRLDDRSLTGGEKRAVVGDLVELVRIALRDWAALALAGDAAPLLAADQRELLRGVPTREPERIAALLGAVGETERLARSNVSAGLVVESLRLALAPVPDEHRSAGGPLERR